MIHFEPVELRENALVPAHVTSLAAGPGAGSTTEMHRDIQIAEAVRYGIDHLDRKIRRGLSILIPRANPGIDKQAQVRVVNLHDARAGLAEQREFLPQNGHRSEEHTS